MLLNFNKNTYLILAVCILTAAALIENNLFKKNPEDTLMQEFRADLNQNEEQLEWQLKALKKQLAESEDFIDLNAFFSKEKTLIHETGFGTLIYEADKLSFWSDRAIAFYDSPDEFASKEGLVKLPNGYYLIDTIMVNNYVVVGLHLVKQKYTYENKYLQNKFFNSYKLPNNYVVWEQEHPNGYKINNIKGEFLFSILPYENYLCATKQLPLPGAIYFIGLLVLLFYFRKEFVASKFPFALKLFALAGALFIVYWFHLIFEVPKLFFYLKFFSPDFFAISDWLPSLGDYFLLSLFFLFWLYNFGADLNVSDLKKQSYLSSKAIVFLLLLLSASLYLLVNFFVEELIYNSTISFSLNKIIGISTQSVLGMFSMGLFLLGAVFFTIRISEQAKQELSFLELVLILILIISFLAVIQYWVVGSVAIFALLLFFTSTLLAFLVSKSYLETFTLSYLIIFVALVSLYSLVVINQTISKKDREHQRLLAETLVAERDPAAEVFMTEIQHSLDKDPAIQSLLFQRQFAEVEEYIRKSYFNSYFRKYLLNIYVCNDQDSLISGTDNQKVPCRDFMNELVENEGIRIPGTNFYFMDNMNGRISYTGKFDYPKTNNGKGITIYIDLDSDLLFEGIGFPELLIDKSMARSEIYRKFNYAKYYAGKLTKKYGEYNYNYNGHVYLKSDKELFFLHQGNYQHLVFYTSKENYVVVSRKLLTPIDYLIAFPYLFVFYFLTLIFILLVFNQTLRSRRVFFDLKFKIQAAIISIVFVSLLVVALATIFYNVKEYKNKHQNDLNEKMKSIAEEIDMRLSDKESITPEVEIWLHKELAKLSNIFRTDVNIYGVDGSLIASSRFEIFERGLVSTKMNARANYEVFENFEISYFQPEKIGELSYLSAYRPIINDVGDHLGVINLPYFIRQDKYSQEISTFIVAFINLYVLLFLASIIIAVFIANQITRPLVVIQENLQKMQLGKHNKPIQYNRKDEIGSLVKEYNKKVEELAVSANLLARSERESAWREMAKQIAHEIKNPLTPMKLHIQYLQRTKGKDEAYNKHLDRVTRTLIEQIDNLSNIATEFSNFAKIPTARNQVFCLAEQLQKTIDLYETHDKAQISFNPNGCQTLLVNADREQLSRAIINLVRNGIQSVADGKRGKIELQLNKRKQSTVISVKDNGTGIAVDMRDKLFSPNFTTKTSGMGLGLSIVKKIVENFSGKIWFETELGKGTTFFVEIPTYEHPEDEINEQV